MSSTNLINRHNSPTEVILQDAIRKHSLDVLKKYRFEIGTINQTKQTTLLLLKEAFGIEDENLREIIISNSLKTIKKL